MTSHSPSPALFPKRLAYGSAIVLAVTLFFAILTIYFRGEWSISSCAALLFTLAAVWSVRMLVRPYSISLHPVLIPLCAIVLLGVGQLATGVSISRWNTVLAISRWAAYAVAFMLALQLGARPIIRHRLLTAFLYFGFAFTTIAAVQYLTDPTQIFGFLDPPYSANWLGPFSNKDHYASFVQLLLPIALYQAFARKIPLILGGLIAAMMFASVIEGASRAGSFLVVAETAIALVLVHRRKLPAVTGPSATPVRTIAIPIALIAALILSLGWTRLWERAQEANPYLTRQQILRSCADMIRERPFAGFGLGSFETAYPRFAYFDNGEVVGHAHNDWVEWTTEGGAPLTVLVLAIVLLSAPALWRSLWGLGVLSVFTHCLIDFPMNRPAIALWAFTLMGLACGQKLESRVSSRNPR